MVKPVLLIAFNRPGLTSQVLNAIRLVRPANLYIACDGPRLHNPEEEQQCNKVREILNDIDWECNVQRLYQDDNLGCSKGPITAINWFFSNVEAGIILEDDCLPSADFFEYCTSLLDYYKDDESILNICGSNMGANRSGDSGYFYSRFMNMTGWATWRRSAKVIDYELTTWRNGKRNVYEAYKILRQQVFDVDIHWYKYWKDKFDKTVDSEIVTWWDWQWIYYQLNNQKLSIIPNRNLVTNIGFNSEGTHTKDPSNPLANIPLAAMSFPLTHTKLKKPDIGYEEYFVKWVWCYHKRLPRLFYFKFYFSRLLKHGSS
ncbi:hemolytic protein HlpA [soil metagenome]